MANLTRIVKIQQLLRLSGKVIANFGRCLVPVATAGVFGSELSRLYTSGPGLEADWVAGTPARIFGDQLFGQELVPDGVRIGKLTVGPATLYEIAVATGANSTKYAGTINGISFFYNSDSNYLSSADEIVTGLKAYIDGLLISGVTTALVGSATAKTLQVTFAAGTYGYMSLIDTDGVNYGPHGNNRLAIRTLTADPGTSIANQLTAIIQEVNDCFFVVNPYPGLAISQVIATWAAANDKMLIQADPTSEIATHVKAGATDLAAVWQAASMRNAALLYHGVPSEASDAAWVGGSAPTDPGSETWCNRTLAGSIPDNLSETHIDNVLAKNANVYMGTEDFPLTFQGRAADGTPIDLVRFSYALRVRLQKATAAILKNSQPKKVSGSDSGLQKLYGAMVGVFESLKGEDKAIASYTLDLPLQKNRNSADKAVRKATGFPYSVVYNGAIETVEMSGEIVE